MGDGMTVSGDLNIMTLGRVLARSGYFKEVKDEAQAIVKILAGSELGVPPIASMTGIHIIGSKPTLSATLIAAKIRSTAGYDYKIKRLDATACVLIISRFGDVIGESSFTMDDARTAELLSGNNAHSWKHFPRNMLFARAISNAARWYCPELFSGAIYTPDELGAEVDAETGGVTVLPPAATEVDAETGGVTVLPPAATQELVPNDQRADVVEDALAIDVQGRTLPEQTAVAEQGAKPGLMRTDQQLAAIWRLVSKLGWDADQYHAWLHREYGCANPDVLTFVQASRAIADLQRRPEAGG